jgi:hypothetical protein
MKILQIIFIGILLLSFMVVSCSKTDESEKIRIPGYPNAVDDQAHGIKGLAQVKRVITSDSFDTVLAFYKEHLNKYNPKIESFTLEDGRQTAITVGDKKKQSMTVAIQEFKKENKVAIVYMGFGF